MKNNPTNSTAQTRLFAPSGNSECLCGSGKKFKRCCAADLPGFDIRGKKQAAIEAKDYKTALIAARSDVAQYSIWHKRDTAPQVSAYSGELPKSLNHLLIVDVEALSYYVQSLSHCYQLLGQDDEFSAVLERLRSNIDHPRWHRKIAYLHALQALGKNWDHEAGKKELKKLGSMEEETDVQILQLYVSLLHNELSFSTRQTLLERIASLAEKPAERLHYQLQNAVNLLMIDDEEGAAIRLQSAIRDYDEVREEDAESVYALDIYASSIEMLGQIRQDKSMLDSAVTLCRKFVLLNNLTKEGVAHAYQKLGDALSSISSWQEAKDAYSIAFENAQHDILKIFMSKCLLCLNDLKAATELIESVEIATLNTTETADYIFTFAQIAIENGDKKYLVTAEQNLRSLDITEPYFKQHKNALLLSVIDTMRTGSSKERTEKTRGLFRKAITVVLRYTLLEPNFCGLGLKFGKILEDLIVERNASPKEK